MARQGLQDDRARPLGAWLVVGRQASPGIMIAATILLGRALQPVELLIGGWKATDRGARRLAALCAAVPPQAARSAACHCPRPSGRLEVER